MIGIVINIQYSSFNSSSVSITDIIQVRFFRKLIAFYFQRIDQLGFWYIELIYLS